jgi:hypothetical protein
MTAAPLAEPVAAFGTGTEGQDLLNARSRFEAILHRARRKADGI